MEAVKIGQLHQNKTELWIISKTTTIANSVSYATKCDEFMKLDAKARLEWVKHGKVCRMCFTIQTNRRANTHAINVKVAYFTLKQWKRIQCWLMQISSKKGSSISHNIITMQNKSRWIYHITCIDRCRWTSFIHNWRSSTATAIEATKGHSQNRCVCWYSRHSEVSDISSSQNIATQAASQ